MVTVHHLDNSRSQRILWLLEELRLPYEIRRYERNPKTMLAPPELKKVHPLGKSPVITDGNEVYAESAAILEYLADTYDKEGRFQPQPGSPEYRRFRYWMHYAEGSLMPPLLLSLVFNRIPKGPLPFFLKPIVKGICETVQKSFVNPQIKTHLDFIEAELGRADFLAGSNLSLADIQMSFPLEAAEARASLDNYPRVRNFLKLIRSRPAYQRALEKGGPFELKAE